MRQGKVYYKDHLAGIVTETDDGEYVFKYDDLYVADHATKFLTFSMPVTHKPYSSKQLFPFF